MTCYKPMIRVEDLTKWEKAKDGHLYHPSKLFSSDRLENYDRDEYSRIRQKWGNYQIIPCKNCIGCRLDYSREWANRGYLEAKCWKNNYFITLTYDEDNLPYEEEIQDNNGITYTDTIEELPWQGTLNPNDMTRFMKNLRKIFERKKKEINIRFMGCGEYGDNTRRPHYHLILFNCNLPKETFYDPHITWNKDTVWKNKWIEQAWGKGMTQIGECNWNSIAYVARYITKKINGNESEEFYAMQGERKEFFRASNQPGIGGIYYEKHKEEIYKNDKILIKNLTGVHWIKPPSYFDKLYDKEKPEEMEKIREKRKQEHFNQLQLKGKTTSLTRWEQLQIEKTSKEDTSRALKRDKTN